MLIQETYFGSLWTGDDAVALKNLRDSPLSQSCWISETVPENDRRSNIGSTDLLKNARGVATITIASSGSQGDSYQIKAKRFSDEKHHQILHSSMVVWRPHLPTGSVTRIRGLPGKSHLPFSPPLSGSSDRDERWNKDDTFRLLKFTVPFLLPWYEIPSGNLSLWKMDLI